MCGSVFHGNRKLIFVYLGTEIEWGNREERNRERLGQRKIKANREREMLKTEDEPFAFFFFRDLDLLPGDMW